VQYLYSAMPTSHLSVAEVPYALHGWLLVCLAASMRLIL